MCATYYIKLIQWSDFSCRGQQSQTDRESVEAPALNVSNIHYMHDFITAEHIMCCICDIMYCVCH